MEQLGRYIPAMSWLRGYSRADAQTDMMASVIVTIMLIPQSLAYAMLAGLPPEVGLYASILPLVAYAIFGSSRTLAVGPVAVVSMMTGTIALEFAQPGTGEYTTIVIMLATLSGLFLLMLGILKLGFLANLLSHPVISGFISASAILIALSQIKHILGVNASGHNLIEMLTGLYAELGTINVTTVLIGLSAIIGLYLLRAHLKRLLTLAGMSDTKAQLAAKAGPVLVVIITTSVVAIFGLDGLGVNVVGNVPSGLPPLALPSWDMQLATELLPAAALISIVGFVESVSVAQSFAAKRRQSIDPNQELVGLGAANISSAISGGFPVTGGFSRSVVSFDAGAKTPMTGVFTALLILITLTFLTDAFFFLPKAVLAATIMVAVIQLIDIKGFKQIWRYSKQDASALIATFFIVLFAGVEAGIIAGVSVSLLLFLWHTSHPHIAVVGRLPGTEHFRNVKRFEVEVDPSLVTVRIDENLFFANARMLEDQITKIVANQPNIKDMVLMCTAVNMVDASALESLERICERLQSAGITMHLSEVKGPVMDRLNGSDLIQHLSGNIYLTQNQAFEDLCQSSTSGQ
ncbi:sodium-independent anion transporter [Marinomonas piezotolerans]|uniref:Sodium-independent anion transporter n=1 Tax=Marinomonas piezotolerans TaxID=2213058 RepID=A0A370U6N4_9GAMM|nr:sulfate permease [Marinomonas piezotolerans]RDL43437.1 sodium-independent anion transporter [Marinomonas piezotolerans]